MFACLISKDRDYQNKLKLRGFIVDDNATEMGQRNESVKICCGIMYDVVLVK